MVQRDRSQPPGSKPPMRLCSPLPRFEIPDVDPPPFSQESEAANSPSLAPVASDIEEEEWAPVPASAGARRARAVALFATIIVPICLLGVFELVTLGGDLFESLLPVAQERMTAAQSWGSTLIAGGSQTRVESIERQKPMTDDEARDLAAMELEQVMGLARVACVDEGMQPTTLWVTATVTQDGKVASIAVEGPTLGRPHVASCVGGIARNLHIPKFEGEPVVTAREITIR